MKKFSITKLEAARPDPIGFAKTLSDKITPYGHSPKSLRWLTAVGNYHRSENDMAAMNYLENSFAGRKSTKKNSDEVVMLKQAVSNYFEDHANRGFTYYSHRDRLEIILNSKVKISGTIWIINTTQTGGYASYTVVNDEVANSWKTELRHPIIQDYLSNMLHCKRSDISVGVINYTTGIHDDLIYDDEDIDLALEELNDIGSKMSLVL